MISSIMIAAWVGNKFAEVRVTTASRRTGGSGWWTRSATGWRWSRCTPGRRPSLSWLSRPESEFSSLIAAILREICSESIRTTKSMLEFGRGEWKQFSHLPLRHPLSGITSTLNWLSCGILCNAVGADPGLNVKIHISYFFTMLQFIYIIGSQRS